MTRELELPPPPPDPDRPLFGPDQDGDNRSGPPSGRRISIDGRPESSPALGTGQTSAPRSGPPAGPMPPGPPAGPMPPQLRSTGTRPPEARPKASGGTLTGVISGVARTSDEPVWLVGLWAGPILLGLLGCGVLLHRDQTGLRPLPLLAGTVILLALAAVSLIRPPGTQSGRSGRWQLSPVHYRPATRFTLRSTNGLDTDCRLAGAPGSQLHGGGTVRCSGRRWRRSGPVRLRRLELLAGPDGPPIRTVEAVLPPLARTVLWADRLGWLGAAAAALELIHLIATLP